LSRLDQVMYRERRIRELDVRQSLFRLCTEVLRYDKLSEKFHKPMLDDWDTVDLLRMRGRVVDTLDLWPRDHIKTWCERARAIRYYLLDPTITITFWHSVEEMAQESAVAIAKMLMENDDLRRLFPVGVLPAKNAKRWYTASGFELRSNRIGDAPSMRAWGAGSEATGGHSRVGILDDALGFNDVLDNQFAQKRRWYQATVRNVVRSDGWVDAIGTRWDREDFYGDWLHNTGWQSKVRACLETDGIPDYRGQPSFLTMEQIDRKRRELGPVMFAYQMMNDVSQSDARPWKPERCEHYCELKDAAGAGLIVIIMDPAAAYVGGEDFAAERGRADGTKDDWAIQVWKIRKRGMRQERIWLDGASSPSWSMDEGMMVAAQMQRRWECRHVAIEENEPRLYETAYRKIARAEGLSARVIHLSPHGLTKNVRWGAFCGRAESEEIVICKRTVPDAEIAKFLDQARNWVPRGKSNGLRHDDVADCACYVMDPEIDSYAPRVLHETELAEWSPFRLYDKEPAYSGGSQWVRY